MEEKWQGTVTTPKLNITPAQAWAVVGDYYGFHKSVPSTAHSCSKVTHLCDGKPGSLRHTNATLPGTTQVHWAKDRLLTIDPEGLKYTYEFVENSMGLGRFVASLGVAPADGDGCVIEWSYDCDPAAGWTHADLATLMRTVAAEMATTVVENAARAN